MQLLQRYEKTIEALQKGHRFQKPIEQDLEQEIKDQLHKESDQLQQALCILQYTSSFLPSLESQLIELLNETQNSEIIIHALNASRKHIIACRQRDGKRLELSFLNALKTHLNHSSWEVKEWVVRTIDECGSQASFFAAELKSIYPSKISMLFNQNKRHVRGIIDLMIVSRRIK